MEEVTTPLRRRRDTKTYIYTGTHTERERERGETQIYTQHIERERGATLLLGFQDITIQKVAGTEPIFFPWFGATTVASLGW